MRRLILNSVLAVFLCAAGPELAAAQSTGIGGILDFIHKLSGPPFIGVGATAYTSVVKRDEETRLRGRFTLSGRTSVAEADEVVEPDANILMLSFQPALEIPIVRDGAGASLDVGPGFGLHYFFGDVDGFWHYSIPILLQARVPIDGSPRIVRLGLGIHYFPEFGADDFAPLTVDVSRDGPEYVLQLYLGIDFRIAP